MADMKRSIPRGCRLYVFVALAPRVVTRVVVHRPKLGRRTLTLQNRRELNAE